MAAAGRQGPVAARAGLPRHRGPNPRNPRHSDTVEGGRNRVGDSVRDTFSNIIIAVYTFLRKTTVLKTFISRLQLKRVTWLGLKPGQGRYAVWGNNARPSIVGPIPKTSPEGPEICGRILVM